LGIFLVIKSPLERSQKKVFGWRKRSGEAVPSCRFIGLYGGPLKSLETGGNGRLGPGNFGKLRKQKNIW